MRMGRAGKDRLHDRRVEFRVEGRVEDDGIGGWGCGRVEYRECWLIDDLIKANKFLLIQTGEIA